MSTSKQYGELMGGPDPKKSKADIGERQQPRSARCSARAPQHNPVESCTVSVRRVLASSQVHWEPVRPEDAAISRSMMCSSVPPPGLTPDGGDAVAALRILAGTP